MTIIGRFKGVPLGPVGNAITLEPPALGTRGGSPPLLAAVELPPAEVLPVRTSGMISSSSPDTAGAGAGGAGATEAVGAGMGGGGAMVLAAAGGDASGEIVPAAAARLMDANCTPESCN